MKKTVLLFIILIMASCSRSVIGFGAKAEENATNLADVKTGMDAPRVSTIMGPPYKSEVYNIENSKYLVWYYIIEPVYLGQTRLISKNFIPLVFKDGYLKGWGWQYYNVEFNVENKQNQQKEAIRQKYTNDKEEWPRNEHQYVEPIKKNVKDNVNDVSEPTVKEIDDTQKLDQDKESELIKKESNRKYKKADPAAKERNYNLWD